MKILVCGDVVGRSGREAIQKYVPLLREKWALDLVIVNGENAARGFGISESNCKEFYEVEATSLKRFGFKAEDADQMVQIARGKGCDNCRHTGYKGRIGFYELLSMNEEIAELIIRRAPLGDLKAAAKENGMSELREDGLLKVLAGQTTPEEVMRVVFTAGF